MAYHLGVDLGTTYTAAAVSRDGRAEPVTLGSTSVAIPSVAYLADDGEVIFGQPAVRRATTESSRVAREFKRRVGDPTPLVLGGTPMSAEMLTARLLAWVVAQVSTTEGGAPASLAVTHPANWGTYKLDLLGQAIRHVGLEVDHLVPEPVAAASFYAAQRDLAPGTVVAVYDLGGGTFDAAVVRAEPTGFSIIGQPDGIERLGGIDFDHAVLRHVATSIGLDLETADPSDAVQVSALSQLRHVCVEAKEALSAETDAAIPVMLPNRHTEVRLTRAEFEAMIRPSLDETLVALRRTITSAQLMPEDVAAVLLVGGSSRIPLVGQLVAAELDRPIAVDARPKDAIPMGAAITTANAAKGGTVQAPVAPPTPTAQPGANVPPPRAQPVPPRLVAAPTAASSRSKALWWAAAALLLLGGAGALAYLLSSGDDGGDDETELSSESDEGGASTTAPPDDPPDDAAGDPSTSEGLEGGSIEDIVDQIGGGEGLGSGEPPGRLPGDDWGEEARSRFVDDCVALGIAGAGTAEDQCGCIYDEVADAGIPFDEFNDAYVSEYDPNNPDPAAQVVVDASLNCMTS